MSRLCACTGGEPDPPKGEGGKTWAGRLKEGTVRLLPLENAFSPGRSPSLSMIADAQRTARSCAAGVP